MDLPFSLVFVLCIFYFSKTTAVSTTPSTLQCEDKLIRDLAKVEFQMGEWDTKLRTFEDVVLSVLYRRKEESTDQQAIFLKKIHNEINIQNLKIEQFRETLGDMEVEANRTREEVHRNIMEKVKTNINTGNLMVEYSSEQLEKIKNEVISSTEESQRSFGRQIKSVIKEQNETLEAISEELGKFKFEVESYFENNQRNFKDEMNSVLKYLNNTFKLFSEDMERMQNEMENISTENVGNIEMMKELQYLIGNQSVELNRCSEDLGKIWFQVKNNTEQISKITETMRCHREWTYGNGSCYYVSVEQKTWSDARAFCEQFDAHLAVVTSADEEQITKDIIQGSHARGTYTWLGCYEPGEEGRWYLVTGEPFIYTNWGVSIQVVEIEKIALTGVMGGMTINVSVVTTSYVKCEKAVK
ncbi:C-type lectin domain family 4 member F-like [Mercenaria mercenaria]|uniref:C-type lectin domain family 4 member F-like n=1 Tax=Mercenaria mercenaria TaxID=6596 RepID=UPI00234E66EA|nr:C-type lectin domain family 4 member F-like [Mercenaria mercenaria]